MGKPNSNGVGHNANGGLSDEDAAALTTYYQLKITEAQRKVDALNVDLRAARGLVNSHFKRMTADLQFTRRDFEAEVIAKLNMSEAEYLAAERKRDRLHRLAGLKSGDQLDMLDALADTVDDEIAAEANGYRAGRRGDDPSPPKEVAGIMQPAWMRGWSEGQKVTGEQYVRAQTILEARDLKKPELKAEEPEAEPEVDDVTVIDAKARKLKKAGWAEPTKDEATFAPAL